MATTTFTNGVTLSDADWFNDVDAAIYQGVFPTGATALTVTGATTLAVFNTIATTINAFGAATTLNIGAAGGAAAFPGGISIPTGKTITGTGTATVTGFATVSATTLAGTLSTAAQPNITSVGTLTSLTVSGNTTLGDQTTDLLLISGQTVIGHTASVGTNPNVLQLKAAGSAGSALGWVSANTEIAGSLRIASSATNSMIMQVDPENLRASSDFVISIDGTTVTTFTSAGITVAGLAGVGNRYVYIDANGLLTAGAAYP